ncbi:hypothetical protein ACFQ3N_17465 [Virgibacillus byunsanensis]|uniref:VCBS repeat-containing protein n=1 Tax=Virgibacillus byunsanensis TaxID=570945 RepID=A0ABW3LT12_9BACI
MKQILYITGVLFISTQFLNTQHVVAEPSNDQQLIETYQEDITGDGQKDDIKLEGILFSPDTTYYRSLWVDITTSRKSEWTINYEGGYDPSIQFIDLNHDDVNDIFFQSATGGSGGLYNYYLHTLANEKVKEIPLPEPDFIKGQFIDDFKAELTIAPGEKPLILNLEEKASEYIQLDIYNKKGRLMEETSLMIDPIAFFEPISISKSKGYGLKSYQQVSGAYHADQLGTIETLWYFEDDIWTNVKTQWVPAGE